MIADMDEQVGRLLQALRDSGADRDTLVVFTSDNGAERIDEVVGTTAGLRGAKR
jgi:arylsulfatase A-like enzyme